MVPEELLANISRKLDVLILLVAASLVDGKKQREQIRLLANAGISPTLIADMLGTTTNTVNVALSALRKDGVLRERRK